MRAVVPLLCSSLFLCACPPPAPPEIPALPSEPWTESDVPLEVGTGASRFVPVEDGETLWLESGFQGGQHVWVSLRADGVPEEQELGVGLWLVDVATGEVAAGVDDAFLWFAPEARADDGRQVAPGLNLVVWDVDAVEGKEMRVHVRFALPDGRVARGLVTGVVDWWDGEYPDAGPDAGLSE